MFVDYQTKLINLKNSIEMPDTHFSSTELPLRRPIVYGTSSTTKGKEVSSDPSHTHKWTVYLRGLHGEDISYMIERVEFKLHETYAEHIRGRNLFDSVCSKAPYEVTETGWGEFEIGIAIFWTDPDEKSIAVSHRLQLYPSETNPIRDNTVINETYDEIEFHTPTVTIMEALKANPWNSLVKPYPSEPFGTTHLI